MKIGIIVAMGKELALLLPLIEESREVTVNDIVFHIGRIHGHEVIAMQCGIGKVNAAVGTLTLIENFHPDLIINSGVAGGTGGGAGVLDVVVADRVAYHDVWCGPNTVWGQVEGMPQYYATAPLDIAGDRVMHGLIASGDVFVSHPEEIARIKALYPQVMAVDMESGAIAQVCHIKHVPMAVIRVVSDTPGSGNNFDQYVTFWDDAPARTFHIISSVLASL